VEHIAHEASRLSRIARSLLILARAQTGEEPPTRDVFPLRPILDEVAASFSTKVTIRCDESVTVFTDAHLFLQAATNLASNAVRYGDGAGIVIEAREAGSNVTQIDVLDGGLVGHGSGTDHRARFRTADPDSGGFGLGLSIAEQSLHAVGGHLELREGMARIELPTADWTA
jgi:signal transduction histidine kinase